MIMAWKKYDDEERKIKAGKIEAKNVFEESGLGYPEMTITGFDAFRLVQTYFSDAYLDLSNEEDQKMYRDWCLYNMKLLFQNFEESLPTNPEDPEIENPEGA